MQIYEVKYLKEGEVIRQSIIEATDSFVALIKAIYSFENEEIIYDEIKVEGKSAFEKEYVL